MEDKPRVRAFVPETFEGVTSAAILQEILDPQLQLDIQYTRHLDFRDYHLFKDAEVILVLGFAYKGYALPDGFYTETDVPFMDFIHSSTYGERIEGKHILSTVNEDMDPIKDVCRFIELHPESTMLSKYVTFSDKARLMIDAVNAYRTWTWSSNSVTRVLHALYHASRKWLPNLIKGKSLQDVVKEYAPVIQGQMEKMNDYIVRKRETTKAYNIEFDGVPCVLKVVFADEYINELANDLLNMEPDSVPVIVCIGRSTKSNDMFSIRTKGVHAGNIAYLINEGSGKETVANVFSGVGYSELVGNSIVKQLNQSQRNT